MKRFLITGAEGFIGSAVTDALIHRVLDDDLDVHVTLLDAREGRVSFLFGDLHELVGRFSSARLDIRQQFALTELGEFDVIIHLAALIDSIDSIRQPEVYWDTNLDGTSNVLKLLKPKGCFIFASSAAVYGIPEVVPSSEEDPLKPISPYGETKLAAEQLIRDKCSLTGSRAQILRFFNVAGTYKGYRLISSPQFEKNLFAQLEAKSSCNEAFVIEGACYETKDGTCERDFLDINWLARFLAELLLSGAVLPSFVANVGCGVPTSVLSLVEALRLRSSSFQYCIGPPRDVEIPSSYASVERLAKIASAIGVEMPPQSVVDIAKAIRLGEKI